MIFQNKIILYLMKKMYVYIMGNHPNGTTYVGVTNDLVRRVYEHKNKVITGFTFRYGLDRLVYYEVFDDEVTTIAREKTLKNWKREWKLELIEKTNPGWEDLYSDICR